VPVDVGRFPNVPRRFAGNITLFYSGSFGLKDGVPVLLDAFDILAQTYPNLRLVMTGRASRDDAGMIAARISRSPYRARIINKGYLEDYLYEAQLIAADIPCMTRINHPYANAGFPYKLAEYLASAKPVIASRISDIPRFLEDGHSAMLVAPGDAKDIANKIEYLLLHPQKAMAIAAEARRIACTHFSHTRQAPGLYGFIQRICQDA
jgi:glycosyltransferase involved in cell wall biosynthesis